MCFLRNSVFNLHEVQGNLWSQPWYVQGWIPDLAFICSLSPHQSWFCCSWDSVDLQHLFGVSGYFAPAVPCVQNRRSWEYYIPLSLCFGVLPRIISAELDLPLLRWKSLRSHRHCCWCCADSSVLWLLLPLCNQSAEGQEAPTTSLKPGQSPTAHDV